MHMVKICALGSASQDVFISGEGISSQLDPKINKYAKEFVQPFKLGAKINVEKVNFATGGGATNAAVTFARQGLSSSFIGKMGNDVAADVVISELDKEYIDSSQVIRDEKGGTQYSTILLTNSGERTILIYRGAATSHESRDYENLDFSKFDWIYVSTFAGRFEALSTIFRKAAESNVKIAFNPGEAELADPGKLKALLEDVEILLVNKEEAQQIVPGENLDELTRHLLKYAPISVVSDGPNGVMASDGKVMVRAGMYEDVPVLDRTGAGDAFGSGLTSQIAQGKSLKEAVIFGSANSTSVVQYLGAKQGILREDVKLHDMPLSEKPF